MRGMWCIVQLLPVKAELDCSFTLLYKSVFCLIFCELLSSVVNNKSSHDTTYCGDENGIVCTVTMAAHTRTIGHMQEYYPDIKTVTAYISRAISALCQRTQSKMTNWYQRFLLW